ncbi:hypothetical protein Q4519_13055 [Motilimonas sp. 1_MG-2023]|uniref:hypothetical protein n=1 Tax=Motilimonas sp. 1_MG-2023 TaxID=3062672 RepID=UPI0026E49620|nr:hypothetical protein [Motilimonas sp. 1_MG-2023]MDO6526612.1 hypothetical protein [Motilimonas sp. 1_MG-2023]
MRQVDWHYKRPELATQYLKSVGLSPISRIALLGVRRIGKTAFLLKDLAPKASELGFVPIYLNIWENEESPQEHIIMTLDRFISSMKSSAKQSIKDLLASEVKKLDINLGLIKATVDTSTVHTTVTPSEISQISEQIKEVIRLANEMNKRPLFIIDEVQILNSSEKFLPLQACLRTNFDTFDEICAIYAGSSRGGVAAMFNQKEAEVLSGDKFAKREMPFYNSASLVEFPHLEPECIDFFLGVLAQRFSINCAKRELSDAFKELDYSPFWLRMLLTEMTANMQDVSSAMKTIKGKIEVDGALDYITVGLSKLDKLVYLRLHGTRSKYSQQDMLFYSEQMGKSIKKSSVQNAISKLKRLKLVTEYDAGMFFEKAGLKAYIEKDLNL